MRLQFCRQFVGILTEYPDLPNKLLISDEEHFHFHGTVNKQNFRYWPAADPHELHQHSTVWCAIWSRGVTGRYFFEDEDGKVISHIATLHRDDQYISIPESSTKQWHLVVPTRWCYDPHGSD
jgi:hypothetical protein